MYSKKFSSLDDLDRVSNKRGGLFGVFFPPNYMSQANLDWRNRIFSFLKSRVVWFKKYLCTESENRSSEKKMSYVGEFTSIATTKGRCDEFDTRIK